MRKKELLAVLSTGNQPITYKTLRNWFAVANLYDEIPDLNRRRIFTPAEVAKIKARLN
ncbi:hypothetical protein ACAW74_18245 [Fibrella sp. WM1]|uniref:hypothetical protein n=1 Tax=Fibrella musci TaxID=3242485 RepID=UPI0035205F3B